MSNKIYKNLIVNQVDELNELDNEKIVVVTTTGELKQVDKSKVGGNISGFLPLNGTEINQPLTNTIKYNGANPIIDNENGTGIFYQNGLTKIYSQYNTSLAINYTGNGVINEMSVTDSYTSLNAWRTTESGDYDYGSQTKVIADQVSILHNNSAGGMSSINIKNNIDIVSWWNDATNSISLSGEENRISITNNSEDGSQVGGIYVINGNPKAIKGFSDEAFIATENSDLITKEYFDSNQALFVNATGGYATNQRKLAPDSFGKLGARALDFSFTTPLLIGQYGATGDYSFAHGLDLKSNGYLSVTFGRKNVNNGEFNIVNGEENTLTGSKQIVIGYKNQASLIGGLVIGSNNIVVGQESMIVGRGIIKEVVDNESVIGWYNKDFTGDETERVFTIANGLSNEERSNALVVYKNGLIVAPSSTNQLINDDLTNKSLVTKEYLNPATLINILTSATADQKNQIKSLLGL